MGTYLPVEPGRTVVVPASGVFSGALNRLVKTTSFQGYQPGIVDQRIPVRQAVPFWACDVPRRRRHVQVRSGWLFGLHLFDDFEVGELPLRD